MAITRTAKGTVADKSATSTLTLSNVSMNAGDLLVIGLAYETDAAISSVKYGKKDMRLVADSGVTVGDTRCRLYRFRVKRTSTRDVVVTWAATMSARAMFATSLTEVGKKDVGQTRTEDPATTDPATGPAATSTVANTISIAAFASTGPSGDTPGTAGVGHTLGQRVGTTGGAPATNVTIQETYEILSATGNIRSTLTGATSRRWANTIVAFAAAQTFTVKEVIQHHRDINEEPDWVRVRIEDENNNGFWWLIPPEDFDAWSDSEITEEITRACSYRATRNIDDESNVDEDSARDTRMATFVNDTIIV